MESRCVGFNTTSTRNITKFPNMLKLLKKTRSPDSRLLMRCGHTWARKRINNGFGLQLIAHSEKLSEYILALAKLLWKRLAKRQSAKQLWQSLPSVYRQCAFCYTDFWEAYERVLPSKRHKAVGKDSGKTSYIERFNNTLRQRLGRLVRKTLSFSKTLDNHIGAIWYFVHHRWC